VKANFNALRVWGGGFYPNDWFYELCDQYGLIIWQDFMFACMNVLMSEEFTANVKAEFVDVLKRIRHHASLGLLCGNNEMEFIVERWPQGNSMLVRTEYHKTAHFAITA
jgi:beta-mannosidase